MKIQFKLETLGSISAEFHVNNDVHKVFHSSDFGDRFQDLLNKLFFIYDAVCDMMSHYFPLSVESVWQDDFIHYNWLVSMESINSDIKIQVVETYPNNPGCNKELFCDHIDFKTFFDFLYTSLDEMLQEFGFIGYKKNWEVGNFPIAEYLTLKSKAKNIALSGYEPENFDDKWKQKVIFRSELDIIELGSV